MSLRSVAPNIVIHIMIPCCVCIILYHRVHLNYMLNTGNLIQVRCICVKVRNGVSMETDQGDMEDACLFHSAPVNADRSQHEDWANCSLSFAFDFSLFACVQPSSALCLLFYHSCLIILTLTFPPELSCLSVVETDRGKWTVEECLHRKKGVFWSVISDGPTAEQTVANYTYCYNKTLKPSTCTSILRIDCEHNIIISSLISDATIRGWKRYQTSLRIQDAILAFPYIVHIVSTIHSPMCLTSALHISLLLPRHNNQWFIWSWLNCFFPSPLPRKGGLSSYS